MNENIIYEDVNSKKYLLEMCQVYSLEKPNKFSILIGFTPEDKIGNCYFKVYNHPTDYSSATKVIRIKFTEPVVITGHRERKGKSEWLINEFSNDYRKELIEYLNSKSLDFPNVSVWTALRFKWNQMKQIRIPLEGYISGKGDEK